MPIKDRWRTFPEIPVQYAQDKPGAYELGNAIGTTVLSLLKTRNAPCPLHFGGAAGILPVSMIAVIVALLGALRSTFRSHAELVAAILALRHQLAVLRRQTPVRLRLRRINRVVWVVLSRAWSGWRQAVQIVSPDTVVRWHRRGFALYWRWKSRPRRPGRPAIDADIRRLIRDMHTANPLWGAPRVHGELRKHLGGLHHHYERRAA